MTVKEMAAAEPRGDCPTDNRAITAGKQENLTNPRRFNVLQILEMLFPSCQTVKIKWLDELAFVTAFLLLTVINKHELIGSWRSSPISYQSWQLFFSFIIFTCLLIHPRIRNEVKILDRANLISTLPICIGYFLAASAGAVALSELPIPVFLAWSNLCPAILALIWRRRKKLVSAATLGGIGVCISIAIIFVIDAREENRLFYLCVFVYAVINLAHFIYLKRKNLQIPDFTLMFYANLISFFALFPVGVYNALETHPGFSQMIPSISSGFLNLLVQIFTFRVRSKNARFLIAQAIAQLMTVVLSVYLFDDGIDLWVWALIIINWFTTGFILDTDEDANKNDKFILVVPQIMQNVYEEKYINYNMA